MDGDVINFDLPDLIGGNNALSHFTVFSAVAPSSQVPLPMSIVLLLSGLGGLAWTARGSDKVTGSEGHIGARIRPGVDLRVPRTGPETPS